MIGLLSRIVNRLSLRFYELRLRLLPSKTDVHAYWWNERVNLGDILTPFLISQLAKSAHIKHCPKGLRAPHILAVGSILKYANRYSTVWGSGFIQDNEQPLAPPGRILAVRGPRTRERLLQLGIDCPAVYGDPALLLPRFLDPPAEPIYEYGFIPHYIDKAHPFLEQELGERATVIDIETHDIETFIRKLKSCRKVFSSSLHGIILADAYGIPARRVKFSNDIVGGDFKFEDYYLSVGRRLEPALQLDVDTDIDELNGMNFDTGVSIDCEALLNTCPFTAFGKPPE